MSTSKVIELKSSDEMIFEVELAVAMEMQTIKWMIGDKLDDDAAAAVTIIPVPMVTSKILAKVIEYCKRHVQAPKSSDEDLKSFNSDFVKVDQDTLLELFLAANYLHIDSLLDLISQTVADMMTGQTTEKIAEIFKIKNDFTPEEMEVIHKNAHPWAWVKRE